MKEAKWAKIECRSSESTLSLSLCSNSTATATKSLTNGPTGFWLSSLDNSPKEKTQIGNGWFSMVPSTRFGLKTWTQSWMITKNSVWTPEKSLPWVEVWTWYSNLWTLQQLLLPLFPVVVWFIWNLPQWVGNHFTKAGSRNFLRPSLRWKSMKSTCCSIGLLIPHSNIYDIPAKKFHLLKIKI